MFDTCQCICIIFALFQVTQTGLSAGYKGAPPLIKLSIIQNFRTLLLGKNMINDTMQVYFTSHAFMLTIGK